MPNSEPLVSPDHQKGKALYRGGDSPVPPGDESFFDTPPDVIFLPESQSLPTDRTDGSSKQVPVLIEMVSQPQYTASTGEGLPSPVTVGASPAVPIDVDARAGGTPGGSPGGGKKGNKKLTTRKKASKIHTAPPILVSPPPSPHETTPEPESVGEGGKSVVAPQTTPAVTEPDEGGGKPTSLISAPRTGKAGIPSSSTTPPPSSGDGVRAPSPNEQTEDTKSAPVSSQNTRDADWLRQQPIPANLEELVRLFASKRRRLSNENILDVLASKDISLSR